jgi:hypothetical protein
VYDLFYFCFEFSFAPLFPFVVAGLQHFSHDDNDDGVTVRLCRLGDVTQALTNLYPLAKSLFRSLRTAFTQVLANDGSNIGSMTRHSLVLGIYQFRLPAVTPFNPAPASSNQLFR